MIETKIPKGWRELKLGMPIRATDKHAKYGMPRWVLVGKDSAIIGDLYCDNHWLVIRRKS